ncbi:MAG: S46 family peptidase [Flavobacteriales bacterium]|nr:S46 family peptidase [Flavobacteriales bacterium]
MKKLLTITAAMLFLFNAAKADEGMWLMHMLKRINEAEMQNLGLNLTAEEIYDINNASLKDAIVRLNGGMCTAEVISSEGLVLTNHHCAYGAIQSFSAPEHDYLTDGFWAFSKDQEMHIADFEVSFLVRIDDVTKQVLANVTDSMSEDERAQAVAAASKTIREEASKDNDFDVEVKEFFYGNEYYLFVYNTYKDIRLVGAPPESVGKYGGDTDNWMWPRHTGDFSLLRIYADKENQPATFSEENVPLSPKRHLNVSMDGVAADDFTMIMGYPGSTDRFLSSYGVQQALDTYNPSVVEVRDLKLKTMKKHMDEDKAVRIKYASKYASTANYWKYYIGQSKGLKRLDVYSKKKALEDDFMKWANATPDRKAKYGDAIGMIADYYKSTDATVKSNVYALEAGLIGADITLFTFRLNRSIERAMGITDEAERKAALEGLTPMVEDFFKDYDMATDKDVLVNMMNIYMKNIAKEQQPSVLQLIGDKFKNSPERFADKMYASSFLVDKQRLMDFLANPNMKKWNKDLAVINAKSMANKYFESFANPDQAKFDKGYRLFVDGLRQMLADKAFYPDANSTMRLTYGTVGDYYPADAVHYDFITTANGILEKYDPSNPEFVLPERLIELIDAEDFGQWTDENGELVVCFISNNDITGGNSGSPVLNANGDLIGLAFDGNWEAMSGDIAFEPELQRTISVDIRYVMFIIDKYAGATNLIEEIDFVKSPPPAPVVEEEVEEVPAPAKK